MESKDIVPLLHYTVSDAVASLTRKRIRQDGPFLLQRPRSPLVIDVVSTEEDDHGISVMVRVSCPTWDGTVLNLPLSSSNKERNDWLAWGKFSIAYGTTLHPALSGTTITKRIEPSFATSNKGLPMKYQVRPCVIR